MGLSSTKSSIANAEYALTFSSSNRFYRGLSTIEGEFQLSVRKKLRIEREIRIDLIGILVENKKYGSRMKKGSSVIPNTNIFFTYSHQILTSHNNGTARVIKGQDATYPFRIPLGNNLPPSCELKDFSISYYLEIFHDGRALPNTHTDIILAPALPQITAPAPCRVTGFNDVAITCNLQKSFYSGQECPTVPLVISIANPKQKQIKLVTVQLMQTTSLNGTKRDNEIFTTVLHEIPENTRESELIAKTDLILPANLSPTFVPNQGGLPDNMPAVAITYEFRLTAQMKGATTPNVRLSVPIGIH